MELFKTVLETIPQKPTLGWSVFAHDGMIYCHSDDAADAVADTLYALEKAGGTEGSLGSEKCAHDGRTYFRLYEDTAVSRFKRLADSLPDKPADGVDRWSNGWLILCRDEDVLDMTVCHIEENGEAETLCTGYFDPEEDERGGETDVCTGWYYVSIE